MDPVIQANSPVLRIVIVHAFSRGERFALSRYTGTRAIMGTNEKTPSERTRTMEEVKAAVVNLWKPILDMKQEYKLGYFLNGIGGALIAAARANSTAAMRLAQSLQATNFSQAMIVAAGRGNLEALRLATEARAVQFRYEILSDINTPQILVTKEEKTLQCALEAAARNGQVGAMQVLTEGLHWYFPNSILELAASRGQIAAMKLAIKHDAGGDGFDSAFAEAAKAGQLEAMQYLEEAGADDYQWAIDSAAERGQRGAIRWLIEGKRLIDLNEALYFAAFGNHVKTMRLLVENGATNFFVPIDRLLPSERMKALLTKVMISHLNPKARQRAGLAEPARRKSA